MHWQHPRERRQADEECNAMEDDPSQPEPDHVTGTGKGEEVALNEGREPGREEAGTTGADRPAGTRTARDATGVAKDTDPIDPDSPPMPPA
jgi:hypothetical protein